MTTKLSVGVSRKIGQPNFGSACATCHMEIEIDNALASDHDDTLTQRIRRTFELCRREVDQELAGYRSSQSTVPAVTRGNTSSRSGVVRDKASPSRTRPATDAQIRAIHAIASKANVRLASELDAEFGVASPQSLTLQQASELIEKLKGQLAGQ
ncbi:regulatory protein GemA [Aporhodopirellula aestuarii]|uniref:Regulatory protein GemA n=1 Tax=Aporhodopirellula aestuarii TaxID=2950107 RepID=A0ABT0U0N5_9BACT|nr:regulatory protein GemA [Aporhodopirellula aestuarii]MCM2370386.1 regulatory protein GemA [Aporhodopirellula aestuarii]